MRLNLPLGIVAQVSKRAVRLLNNEKVELDGHIGTGLLRRSRREESRMTCTLDSCDPTTKPRDVNRRSTGIGKRSLPRIALAHQRPAATATVEPTTRTTNTITYSH